MLLDHWDLPAAVFPFNIIIVLYLLCTGTKNPYFPHNPVIPPGAAEPNDTTLIAVEVRTKLTGMDCMSTQIAFKINKIVQDNL